MLFMQNVVRKDQYIGYIQSLLERDDLELGECIDDYAKESIKVMLLLTKLSFILMQAKVLDMFIMLEIMNY